MERPLLHVISHTDLDGVAAAALAWHVHRIDRAPVRVSLTGYGEVDNLILETLEAGQEPLVLDLFCQRQETVDEVDRRFPEGGTPFLFDHHQTTFDRYGNRPWAVIRTDACGALVYHRWLEDRDLSPAARQAHRDLTELVLVANDRDLWLGQREDGRLWQALVTLLNPTGVLLRLCLNPGAELTREERRRAETFVEQQEARFARARTSVQRTGNDLSFLSPGILEYGDVSDFCGLLLDRDPNPPRVVAVAARRPAGDWAVSLRSREGLAGKLVGLLRDGRKVRGGGHGDAAALYFPTHFKEEQILSGQSAHVQARKRGGHEGGVSQPGSGSQSLPGLLCHAGRRARRHCQQIRSPLAPGAGHISHD